MLRMLNCCCAFAVKNSSVSEPADAQGHVLAVLYSGVCNTDWSVAAVSYLPMCPQGLVGSESPP